MTGASSGIGLAVARLFSERGLRVIGTSRNPDGLTADRRIPGVEYLPLDLADRASVQACAGLTAELGGVDVLVNNAGESQLGPLEDTPIEAIERLFATNVFGQIQLTQLLLPQMRAREFGRIVMVGSMLASFPQPFRSAYVASKAALRGFVSAARGEVSPYGVRMTVVEPGYVRTGIGDRRTRYLADGSPYADRFGTVADRMAKYDAGGISAKKVATRIAKVAAEPDPKPLYAVGSNAPVVFALRRVLSRRTVERMMARRVGL